MDQSTQKCPLCSAPAGDYGFHHKRAFFSCAECGLLFSDRRVLLTAEEARGRYLLHEYDADDPGYRRFLAAAADPAMNFLEPSMRGLDYGSGPARVLETILRERGIPCVSYDPFFLQADIVPPYDFIFSTEVFEHFEDAFAEIRKVVTLLKDGGILIVMTELFTGAKDFAQWHYIRDETHVSFYRPGSFLWIARHFSLTLLHTDDKRVVILKKTGTAGDS